VCLLAADASPNDLSGAAIIDQDALPVIGVGTWANDSRHMAPLRFRLAMGSIIPAWDPRRVVHAEDRIMDDERQRPRGATGSICAVTENKIREDPKQLDLWSAAQPTNNECEADKTLPTRAPGQGAEPKFLLIEPIVTVPQAASSCDHEIRAPRRDKLVVSAPSAGAQWLHPALVNRRVSGGAWLGMDR
jgi:hypothetical protein